MKQSGKLVLIAAAVAAAWAAAAQGQVQVKIDRAEVGLKKITIIPNVGKAKLVLSSRNWGNTDAYTPKGKRLSLIDPFFYAANVRGGKSKNYLNHPEIFATWVTQTLEHPNRPDAAVLAIGVAPPDGLRKDVTITIVDKETVAYVHSKITVMKDLRVGSERQCHYVTHIDRFKIYIDGKLAAPEKPGAVPIEKYVVVYDPRLDASYGMVFLEDKLQKFPHKGKTLGSVNFYFTKTHKGADIQWGKGGGSMRKGQSRSQAYIELWGDGDLKAKAEELHAKGQSGELTKLLYIPPGD